MAGASWTKKDDATLRRHYKLITAAEIAERLCRTTRAVHHRANKLNLNEKRDKTEINVRKKKIKSLLKLGMSDSEVAERVGMCRRALTEMRSRMGIAANGRNQRYRLRVAKRTREQCKKAGVASLAQIRSKRYAEYSSELGWHGLSVRAAQIAEALYRFGPMTRKRICTHLGMPWKGARKSLGNPNVPGGSYMAELQRAGIVVRLQSAITHSGKGNHEDLYMIGLDVEPCRKIQQKAQ